MVVANFKNCLEKLEAGLKTAQEEKISLKEEVDKGIFHDFKKQKRELCKATIKSGLLNINTLIWEMISLNKEENNKTKLVDILNLIELVNEAKANNDTGSMLVLLQKINAITKELSQITTQPLQIKIPNLPSDIKEDVEADLAEVRKCYDAGCYRSVIILCGRILETALHRKYYDVTGLDILEKSPGFGLGKLVAKLSEKEVNLDPALTQQIHLVNQVRIFSVHKKKSVFLPTKAQSQAIILYTTDILEKLFKQTS